MGRFLRYLIFGGAEIALLFFAYLWFGANSAHGWTIVFVAAALLQLAAAVWYRLLPEWAKIWLLSVDTALIIIAGVLGVFAAFLLPHFFDGYTFM